MNKEILHTEVQEFINSNLKSDINKLILKGSPFANISIQELANQIIAKQKSEKKLPTWFKAAHIYYPPKLSIEQTSSELTAAYKAQLVSGNSIIDITGGFGIDAYYFSKQFKEVTHCEINEELSTIVAYNYEQLKAHHITTVAKNGLEYLDENPQQYDCIYIDPSRRDDVKGKVFLLKDCLPNVPENIDFLFSKSNTILIKNSPVLDIKGTIHELRFVKEIHIVGVKNEVKELLFLLEKGYEGVIHIKTINLQKEENQIFDFDFQEEASASYSLPLHYLYEPNTAILKSGGFHQVAQKLQVDKLHQHSHLYTSNEYIDFPGRSFTIKKVIPFDKKQLKKEIPNLKANITTRNFPISVAEIRKKTKLKEGGNLYLFFTTNLENKHIIIICEKYIPSAIKQ